MSAYIIKSIIAFCPNDCVSDNATPAECDAYRTYLYESLYERFDDACIEVVAQQYTRVARIWLDFDVNCDIESAFHEAETIVYNFILQCWDNAPWSEIRQKAAIAESAESAE